MSEHLSELKRYVSDRHAVLFIGPEVSRFSTNDTTNCCDMQNLLKHGLTRCYELGELSKTDFDEMRVKLDANSDKVDDQYDAANKISNILHGVGKSTSRDSFLDWMNQSFQYLHPKRVDLIRTIAELECPILTTNYDTLLSSTLNRRESTWNRRSNRSIAMSSDNLNNEILHIFGHYKDKSSIVFTRSDYEKFLRDESLQSKLELMIESKAIILIGYDDTVASPVLINLLEWISIVRENVSSPVYMLVPANRHAKQRQLLNASFKADIRVIEYGDHMEHLISFLSTLKSYSVLLQTNTTFAQLRESVRRKYLNCLKQEYGHISIIGNTGSNINLPLESVYVELKFDPTHPSIKAMKSVEIDDEFRRKLITPGFFTKEELEKLRSAFLLNRVTNPIDSQQGFMFDQCLNVMLSNRKVFTEVEATDIQRKVRLLKGTIIETNKLQELKQYSIQQAFSEFRHMVILGNPGSGKTTLSKWLAINMAKRCLGETNMLYDSSCQQREKLPILIPIWKYFHFQRETNQQQPKSLLEFLCENPLTSFNEFTQQERECLSWLIKESLVLGNTLVIFEGLDEVPAQTDRSDLMREVNNLLERGIDIEFMSGKLNYSAFSSKEINNTRYPDIGNRFIVTSRIEGNYFEDINFFIPRLTIENMSDDALKLFCSSYMKCINNVSSLVPSKGNSMETEKLYEEIIQNKDILQLAINPQLASVIAAVYSQYSGMLPNTRIELYEKAIHTMVERLVSNQDYFLSNTEGRSYKIDSVLLWSVLQEIAHHLHSQVEGLTENALKAIIEKCLMATQSITDKCNHSQINEKTMKLVDIFKYQAGVLNEFGYDSYRFIHRTFQEYLSAKSILYKNGVERTDNEILRSIKNNIGIPNWRVPLSMTFGILSKSFRNGETFDKIVQELLNSGTTNENSEHTTALLPFVLIDSMNDISLADSRQEFALIRKLADLLLIDYKNRNGFARLKDHQDLIHSYFLKLKNKRTDTLAQWFIGTIFEQNNVAPCANIICQLKWYSPVFHQHFVNSLQNDSALWNHPIDSLLRLYSKETSDKTVASVLKFRSAIEENTDFINRIAEDSILLALVATLYGGYKDYNVGKTTAEYGQWSQFLSLDDKERAPFIFYYRDIWGKDDTAYNIASFLDKCQWPAQWVEQPKLRVEDIYKDSCLTPMILNTLTNNQPTGSLIETLEKFSSDTKLTMAQKLDVAIGFLAINHDEPLALTQTMDRKMINYFMNRVDQIIYSLKDQVARYSSHLGRYFIDLKDDMRKRPHNYTISFKNYVKIYLSLISKCGGLPVDTSELALRANEDDEKCALYGEYLAYKLTGASVLSSEHFQRTTRKAIELIIGTTGIKNIINSLLKMNESTQKYRPVRNYPWPMDTFVFHSDISYDIPITFMNLLENANPDMVFMIEGLTDVFRHQGYFDSNPDLIPIVILLNFGIASKDTNMQKIYNDLLPESNTNQDIKSILFEYSYCMIDPYFKSRLLYQLAEYDDSKRYELLTESDRCAQEVEDPVLKFQILEKIYGIASCKEPQQTEFIKSTLDQMCTILEKIDDSYNRVIAYARISFYESGDFRQKYLKFAVETIMKMNDADKQLNLLTKLKPLLDIYTELRVFVTDIMTQLGNTIHLDLFHGHFGKLLRNTGLHINNQDPDQNNTTNVRVKQEYCQIETMFQLYANFSDTKSLIDPKSNQNQLWINLLTANDRSAIVEQLLETALREEIFLTPQVAMVLDILIEQGREHDISNLFPYIIRPSHEVLPIVYRWFKRDDREKIKKLAALLLAERRCLFEGAVDPIFDLLDSENDQIRYRAQQIFQHPSRDIKLPSKRISLLGEKTLMKIFETFRKDCLPRVLCHVSTFFFDLLWDDPIVFYNFHQLATACETQRSGIGRPQKFYSKIYHATINTWNVLMSIVPSMTPLEVEQVLQTTMHLAYRNQITEQNWTDFTRILLNVDLTQFKHQIYLTQEDAEVISVMLEYMYVLGSVVDYGFLEVLEMKVLSTVTTQVQSFPTMNFQQIKEICRCNYHVNTNFNEVTMNIINDFTITSVLIENLVNWSIQKMSLYTGIDDSWCSVLILECIICLLATFTLKDNYSYRKVTSAPTFDRTRYIGLLEKMLNQNWIFSTRGNAFILLATMNHDDHLPIVNAFNTLMDENVVKEYTMKAIPLITLTSREFLDDLIDSLNHESAIRTHEIMKIFTEFVLNEKLNEEDKSKIIRYISKEVGQLKSKKPINYFYSVLKIPFTTTLEIELYKSWVKIQGLSGKAQYAIKPDEVA